MISWCKTIFWRVCSFANQSNVSPHCYSPIKTQKRELGVLLAEGSMIGLRLKSDLWDVNYIFSFTRIFFFCCCCFFFFKFLFLNLYTVKSFFLICNSINLDKCIEPCHYHHNQEREHFHHPHHPRKFPFVISL